MTTLATDRLQKVLAMVPVIASNPGITLQELGTQFGYKPQALENELLLLPMCGLPPYSPDRLIDLEIIDDQVFVRFAEYFSKPPKLTGGEGLAVLAAGEALLTLMGDKADAALQSALSKLRTALSIDEQFVVEIGSPDFLESVQKAELAKKICQIKYFSASRQEISERKIDPLRTFHANGSWYVHGYCHLRRAERMFRVDRISSCEVLDESFDAAEIDGELVPIDTEDSGETVTIAVPPNMEWVADSIPVQSVNKNAKGLTEIKFRVSNRDWLGVFLARLGPAVVLEAEQPAVEARSEVAKRILARYNSASTYPDSGSKTQGKERTEL